MSPIEWFIVISIVALFVMMAVTMYYTMKNTSAIEGLSKWKDGVKAYQCLNPCS